MAYKLLYIDKNGQPVWGSTHARSFPGRVPDDKELAAKKTKDTRKLRYRDSRGNSENKN